MCDCFHLAFPNWHAASSGTGAGRRLRAPEPGTEDDSISDEPAQFTEGERPRPQGSSPVEEYPETEKYTDSDKECEAEHDPHHKSGSGKKTKKSGLGSMFEKRSTPKMSKLKEVPSPESGVIVKTAKDGSAEGLIYGGGGKEGIFIKEVVPESPASKSLKLKEGDQILSATVYFDNVSYEDAIQILEHAQAYKVKLCLKRKPDITETEPAIESDVIPEDDLYAPEMREPGKTKRRGDARISWPKFPSFGKGRKSRFTRSHSSSEADEQRKLELSPTTSDTDSPIKSQDALKGKKKHKIKLSVLTKRGRISSSEDQDTDAPTSGQISGNILQTHEASDMLSPECLESPSGETPEVYVTEDLEVVEDLRLQKNDQKLTEPQTVQHKVELITIGSTLKTEDLTVALADQESPSGIKSPDGKKKKKERSELKIILGKDKLHKKDAKTKSSPKRLKTLGASIEIADQPENEKSDVIPSFESHTKLQGDQLAIDANTQIISSETSRVISAKSVTTQMEMSVPKVELNISEVALIQKSPQKGEEKTKKGKDIKQKQETKTGPTFKLPKIGFSDIATEETIQKVNLNVEECPKIEQLTTEGTEVKEDPYERLSKSSLSRTKLPKREDIEIPGMEDVSMGTTTKRIKEPKAVSMGHYEEIQAETVQLSIDVDSVKEAVSKLPGFKLPKVDTSGVPIPEEITVIDANAQRISVKTPTKVVDTKTKHEAHFTKFDITASPEISKTTVKLPKITPADLPSEELLIETKVDLKKPEKIYKTKAKQSDKEIKTEVYEREHIIIPGNESSQEAAILQVQDTEKTQGTEGIKFEYESAATLSSKESDKKSKKARITKPSFGISKPDIKIPDIGIDLPKQNISEQKGDNVKGERTIFHQEVCQMSKTETSKGKGQIGGVISDVKIPEIDSIEYIDSVGASPAKKDGGIRLTGFGVNIDAAKPKADISFPEISGEVKDGEAVKHTIKLPKFGAVTGDISVNVQDADKNINIDGGEIKTLEREGKGSKFKMPNLSISMPKVKGPKSDLSLSKKDVNVTLPEAKAEVKLPEVPEVDVTLGNIDERPELEIRPLQTEHELDGQGKMFKMPKFGIKMPKLKGPEFDLSLSKKEVDVTLPEAKAEVKLPEAPEIVSIPEQKMEVKKPELEIKPLPTETELDGQGSKFKMQKLGITMPKVKGPEVNLSFSKKDGDVSEAKANIKIPEDENISVDMKQPESEAEMDVQGSKFKMPHLGFSLPKVKGPQIDLSLAKKDVDVTLPEANAEVKLPEAPKVDVSFGKADVSLPEVKFEVKKPEFEIKPLQSEVELDEQGSKFKMPKLGMSMPKVKGPEIHFSLSKKDGDVTLPEATAEVQVPEVELKEPSAKVEIKAPEIKVAAKGREGSPSKFKMPTFKLPKFGVATPSVSVEVPDMDKDVKIDGADINIPEEGSAVNIAAPNIDSEGPLIDMKTTGTEQDGKGSRFKMPHLGFSASKVRGPKIDLTLSKKDVDVTLPEAKADVKLPEVDLGKADVSIPEAKMEVKKPELEMQSEGELDGQGEKLKMPKFGIKMPKVKGPEIDLSLSKKDVDVTLPQTKVEVKLPDAPKIDVSIGKAEVLIPEAKAEVKKPELEIKPLQTEVEGQGSKFKMPKFGMSMPKVQGPAFHLGISKKDVGVTLPEAKADVNLPDVELKEPSAKVEMKAPEIEVVAKDTKGSPSKFKMPTFSFSMPKVKGPDIDLTLSKKDMDVTLPEAKADVKLPEVDLGKVDVSIPEAKMEVKKPELEMQSEGELDGQGEKLKMPKFGIKMPKVKGPEIDLSLSKKDVDVTLPQTKVEVKLPDAPKIDVSIGKAEVLIPEAKAEVKKPELEIKPLQTEVEGQGSKFKMPKFGMSMPKVQGPAFHLGISKKDVGVTLPEAKADVNLPDAELKEPSAKVEMKAPEIEVVAKDTKGSPSKFKMPTFSFSMPKVKGPDIDLSLSKKDTDITLPGTEAEVKLPEAPKIDTSLGKAEVLIPEAKVEVKKPEVEIKPLQTDTELEGQGGKSKKFGITMPKVKGPEIDLNFSKKDVDVKLTEAKAKVKVPETPEIDINLGKVDVSIPEAKMEVKKPELEMKPLQSEGELDGQGSKFKMPKFGITMPKVKGPEIDFTLSKKDVDIKLPEAKAEVNLPDVELKEPSAEVESKAPEIEAQLSSVKGSPSKFKLPTFKFPKFGIATPNISAEVPDIDKEIKIDGADAHISVPHTDVDVPEVKAKVHLPEVKIKEPSGGVVIEQQPGVEVDAKQKKSRFSLPRFSLSKPSVKAPEVDVSLQDVNAANPEGKVEVKGGGVDIKLPECEADTDGQGSKFKMPKFGITMPKVKGPEIDLSLSKKDVDVTLQEGKAEAELPEAPKIAVDMKPPECEAEIDAQGSKFKMPKFGIAMPQVKGPEFDLSLSKKDVDVTLPEAKAEVKLPDVEVKEPSAEVKIKAPEIKVATKDKEGSPSKFKMPTFKLPKFGIGSPSATVEVPDTYKDVKIDGADIKFHEEVLAVDITAPSIDTEDPSIDIKTTGTEHEGKGSKFKMPKFGITMPKVTGPEIDLSLSKKDVDVTLPEAKAEVKLPDVELKEPSAEMEIKAPEIKVVTKDKEGSPSKFKMPTFKLPTFGVGPPSATVEVPNVDKDIKTDGDDIKIPEKVLAVDIAAPCIDTEGPSIDMKTTETEHEGKGSKFKMPKFGITMPKVKGPEFDLSLSKKDVDVTLPEAKAEVKLPDVELKEPSAEVKIKAPEIKVVTKDKEGSPSKFKMPTFKLPTFGVGPPSATVEVPNVDKDIKIDGDDIKFPEKVLAVDIAAPCIDTEGPSIDMKTTETEHAGKGSKFKMPKFGITMPKVKGPEFDLSLSKKDVDVTLPEAKAEVKLPDVEVKEPSAEVKIKAPEIKVVTKDKEGSPSKFKMPTFKLPTFGVGPPSATVEVPNVDKDIKIDGDEIKIPEKVLAVDIAAPSTDTEGPSIDMKTTGTEHEGKGSKFKMPKFGIAMPKVTGPEIDLSLSKKDVDVTLPEAKAEVKLPDVEVKEPSAEMEIKAPEIKVATKDKEGSPSKFKMPTFKLPKFGIGSPSATVEVPDTYKDVKIDGADIKFHEEVLAVDITAPSIDTEDPSIDIKTTGTEHEGKGSKFKMPKFGIAMPKVTGPEIDLSLSKKDVDVTLPEAKAEVKLPDVEVKEPSAEMEIKAPEIKVATKDKEGSPSKFKMPTFKLPKFGIGSPSATVEVPDTYKDVKIDGADIKFHEEVLAVDITAPSIDTEDPSIDIKTTGTEHEGKGSKFKMPKFGIAMPKVTGPEIDLSLSKKDVDVTLPEAKAEVKLPDVEVKEPSAEMEIKAPEIKVATKDKEGSPSKFKMPTFKLPKFGIGSPSATVEVPDTYKDVKIDGADIKFHEEVLAVDITAPSIDTEDPSIDIKTIGTEHEGRGSKFKMPSLGFSVPQVKKPDTDSSVSKKDVVVTLPEAKTKVQLPDVEVKESSAKVEIKAPGINVQTSNIEGSPSTFKMPTFKLPRFGAATPQVSVEVPDKDIKVDGADLKLPQIKAEVKLPEVDIKEPVGSISVSQAPVTEGDAKTTRSLPRFSFSMTSVKAPEADVNLDVPKVDVTLPEAKTDLHLPDVDIKESSGISIEGAPATDLDAKLKKPRFSLPKFSFSKRSTKEPEVDVHLPDIDVSLPEGNVEVKQPEVELKPPEGDVELDGQESKFKMPKFGISMPKVKGPEIDMSLSKKDVDVTVPEAKAEVQLPDVKIKQASAKVEIKAPEIEAQTGHVEGSSSKLKMPTFTLPRFGAATPKVSVEVPDVDKDIKTDGAKLEALKEGATVNVTAPSIDTEGLSVDVKAKGSELEGSGSKFKMPKFGISMPKVKGPEIDLSLSKKDIDDAIPEAKAEVQLPDVKIKQPSAKVEITAPEIEGQTGNIEGSPSKLKMPTFTLPKFGAATPKVSVEVPDVDKDIKTDGAKLEVPKGEATVDVTAPSIDTEGLSVDVKAKGSELEGSGSKFKMPKFGISMPKVKGPKIDLSLSKKDVDVTVPEAKAEVQLPDVKIKQPSAKVEIKAPEIESQTGNIEGSPSKLKMPTFTLPKFGAATPKVSVEVPDVDKDIKIDGAKLEVPKRGATVDGTAPSIDSEGLSVDVKAKGSELEGSGSKFKMPYFGISVPKVKGPEIDLSLSKKDVDVTLPEAKAEVTLPDAEVKEPEGAISIPDAPTVEVEAKLKRPNWTFPKFSFSRTGGKSPDVDVNIETPKADITSPESKAEVCTPDVEVQGPSGVISMEEPPAADLDANLKKTTKRESKSPKKALTSFGEILKNVDVEFDVPKVEEHLETSKKVHDTDEPSGKQLETTEKETNTKQDTIKSPERTGWFKFPKFGLSSPSEPAKISEKDEHKDEKSSVGETVDEEISPTCSVQSSDAFADISSAMTSEHVGLSLSSPTKVTVKYSDPNAATGPGEIHSNIITSTTRTELIWDEPNLPEKITILSSGVSSSSEDTLRLESGKIHVITSNIQATPEAQHAKLLTAVQVQSAGGLPLKSEANEATSWTVKDSQSGKRTVFERHLLRETSSERSESKETIVITKQTTHTFDSSVSGETASSIQRLRDSVHSEKMRFFDGAEK